MFRMQMPILMLEIITGVEKKKKFKISKKNPCLRSLPGVLDLHTKKAKTV